MLIEILERLYGYDKWIEAEATIESTAEVLFSRSSTIHRDNWCDHVVRWTDGSGETHRATFIAGELSPFFQLVEGTTFTIRFNPVHPGEYYHRALLRRDIRRTALVAIFVLVVTLPFTCLLLFTHSLSK